MSPRPRNPTRTTTAAPTPSHTGSALATPSTRGSQLATRSGRGMSGPSRATARTSTASATTSAQRSAPGQSRRSGSGSIPSRSNSPGSAHAIAPIVAAPRTWVPHRRGSPPTTSAATTIAPTSHHPFSSHPRSGRTMSTAPAREPVTSSRRPAASTTRAASTARPGALHGTASVRWTSNSSEGAGPAACDGAGDPNTGVASAARPTHTPRVRRAPASESSTPARTAPSGRPLSNTLSRHHSHTVPTPGSATTARSPSGRRWTGRRAVGPAHATGRPCSSTTTSESTRNGSDRQAEVTSGNGASGSASPPDGLRRRWRRASSASAARDACRWADCASASAANSPTGRAAGSSPSTASADSAIAAIHGARRGTRGHASASATAVTGIRHSSEPAGRPGHGPAAIAASSAAAQPSRLSAARRPPASGS